MSTTPTISKVLVLPTLAVSLAIVPPSNITAIGAAVLSYTVTVNGGTLAAPVVFTAKPFVAERGFHFVARLDHTNVYTKLLAGETLNVRVVANGSLGSSAASAAHDLEKPETSRPAVVRQRVYELLADEGLQFGGLAVNIIDDEFGRPRTFKDGHVAGRKNATVECGLCYTDSETNQTDDDSEMQHQVEMRCFVPADDEDELELVIAVAEKVRATIYALNLTAFGISDLGWTWTVDRPEREKDLCKIAMTLTLPPNATARGEALF